MGLVIEGGVRGEVVRGRSGPHCPKESGDKGHEQVQCIPEDHLCCQDQGTSSSALLSVNNYTPFIRGVLPRGRRVNKKT